VADAHHHERRVSGFRGALRLGRKGSQDRERLEVDAGEADPRLLAGGGVALDKIPVGDDQQDSMLGVPLAVGLLAEDVVVEHRLLERDREHFLRPVADRVRELFRVFDAADLEHPHTDAIVGDAQSDVLAR
jgi:hypothetical protein